jgi:arylsulfatase A-like enzyme
MTNAYLAALLASLAAACASPVITAGPTAGDEPPNVVLFFTDDQGYGDLGCFGHPSIATPHIDRLAKDGVKLTQFYVASPVCSPSRAALLTGCYPKRIGMELHVVFPADQWGLNPEEETLAELLRERGFATGCFGKWHLGHCEGLLPTDQGFDRFSGVPYSNDMAQFHRKADTKYRFRFPWMEGTQVTEWEPDQAQLTRRQTDAALDFIREVGKEEPFFAYVPFSMPHIPVYASEEFAGTSRRGLYGDVIEEIDAGVGRVLEELERRGLRENTLVIFTSDNGPWLPYGLQGGSAGLLRDGKGTNWEGGQRVPCVMSWPARLPAGVTLRTPMNTMDMLPTIAGWTGASLPVRDIDGLDVGAALEGDPGAAAALERRPFVYFTSRGALAGVRRGPWKLKLPEGMLFDVERDPSETKDLAAREPERLAELEALAAELAGGIEAAARARLEGAPRVFDPERPDPND